MECGRRANHDMQVWERASSCKHLQCGPVPLLCVYSDTSVVSMPCISLGECDVDTGGATTGGSYTIASQQSSASDNSHKVFQTVKCACVVCTRKTFDKLVVCISVS